MPPPGRFFDPYGSRFGSTANFAKPHNFSENFLRQKVKKNRLIFTKSDGFVVAGAGLEPTTSGL